MNTTKILDSEIIDLKIASLPSRPTAPTSFGGKGYTSSQMKAAFDRLPLYIIERFNMLLDDIVSFGEGSLSEAIPTGIAEGHSLKSVFEDIISGVFASYVSMGDETLEEFKLRLRSENENIEEKLKICFLHMADNIIDGASPKNRNVDTGEVVS